MSAFSRHTIVRFAQCDSAGLIFYPRMFELVNEMVEDWFAGPLGVSFAALHRQQGRGVPTVRLTGEFVSPIRLGDTLEQRLAVTHLGESSCRLAHAAAVAGVETARFDHVIVHVDLASMRAMPWPPDLRARMAQFAENR